MNQLKSHSNLPFVSVIIPFFNNHEEVIRIEKKLRGQTYPLDCFEIIFIDNGSTKSFEFPKLFSERNTLLFEKEHINSPYSARNRGVEKSKGEVIVFIDANSTPQETWLENGINCLRQTNSDLIGGKVQFDFKEKVTAGKIVDALTSINMEKAIRERGAAYTANLFVKKEVFEAVGLFEEGVRSGGDVRWTLRAKKHGFSISYCQAAVVEKFARPAKELYRKKIRTGKGYYYSWRQEPNRRIWFYNFFRSLKPPAKSKIKNLNPDRYDPEFDKKITGIWFHIYISGIVEQLAFISEYFSVKIRHRL
ncbi:glycosyltransferase [Rhodohalobacter sp. 614A]|uniref:glycosyltransferase n=1 Tax=Rhodohalobacter sp. 614A TaxID=2908649 RepID=UPI001F3534A9|nr:glycosyltransferase [Rhodohalobacter sp. 614A]